MKISWIIGILALVALTSTAFASTKAIDGSYTYIALRPGTYTFSKFTLALLNGQLTTTDQLLSTAPPQTVKFDIDFGGQPDFVKTLPNGIPADIVLYHSTIDIGDGQSTPVTIAVQRKDDTSPRLTVYAMADDHPMAVIQAYDAAESTALDEAWAKVKDN